MKKNCLLIVFSFCFSSFLIAQECSLETFTFGSQQDIDEFPTNFPNCTHILDDVFITPYSSNIIYNLDSLAQIKSIGGHLFIGNNTHLTSLHGLDSLSTIGGFCNIGGNELLTNLQGLSNLDSIGEHFWIGGNDALENLDGLDNLSFVGKNVEVGGNPMLNNLGAISGIEIIDYLKISNNNALTDLSGISNIITTSLTIEKNSNLVSLSGLANIDIGSLSVIENNQLPNLVGLEFLTEIGGSLAIWKNDNLISLEGLDNLTKIGGRLSIHQNDLLPNLDGLENLTEIQARLFITENNSLTNLDGIENINPFSIKILNNINIIYQDVEIYSNPMLSSCAAQSICDALAIAGATSDIHDNAPGCNSHLEVITDCGVISTLDTCLIGDTYITSQQDIDEFPANHPNCTVINGNLQIGDFLYSSTNITNLDSLLQLVVIEGDLIIGGNLALSNLTGLNNLSKVGGILRVRRNPISSMTGLENLEMVGTKLILERNDSLQTLIGLDNLSFIGEELVVKKNNQLKNLEGLEALTHLGSLKVDDNETFENFIGLENVEKINGDFEILHNDSLKNFIGLENVDSIMGSFQVKFHTKLETFTGLENLKFIGSDFYIFSNSEISNFEPLSNLTHVQGPEFEIIGCNNLTSLTGLDNIEMSDLTTVQYLEIYSNQFLSTLSNCSVKSICDYLSSGGIHQISGNAIGCSSSTEILTDCIFVNNSDSCLLGNTIITTQQEIDDFPLNYPNCTVVQGNLQLGDFGTEITNFDSLQQLISIEGDLVIFYNQGIENLWGLQNLESVGGSLNIKNNSITSLTGLEKLTQVGNDLVINNNDSLSNLIGLENITSIGNEFFIFENDKLENLIGIENLTSTKGLRVHNNLILENFTGLNNLEKIDGSFDIVSNDELTNFIGLENLDSIFGNIFIQVNHQLVNLEGLNKLKYAGNNFSIFANHKLESLTALENLVHIEGPGLRITDHPILKSLEGIDNIEMSDLTSVENLLLQYSDSLSFCSVKSICDYIEAGGVHFIEANSLGCNSAAEILAGCDFTAVKNLEENIELIIFPNPTKNQIKIKIPNEESFHLKIFSSIGEEVFEQHFEKECQVDLSFLPNGIYLFALQNDQRIFTTKVIKN